MSVLDPKQDAAALDPVIKSNVESAIDQLVSKVVPALKVALVEALDGLTVTVTIAVAKKGA